MPKKVNKNKQLSLRISSEIHSKLTTYANAHSLSLTDACVSLLEKGLKAELEPAVSKTDIEMLKAKIETLDANQTVRNTLLLDAIQNQPIAVQERLALEEPTAESQKQQGFFSRLFGK